MEYMGKKWNNANIDIYKINGRNIALDGWNGEIYSKCYELEDNLIDVKKGEDIVVKPIYEEIGEDNYDIVDYIIID